MSPTRLGVGGKGSAEGSTTALGTNLGLAGIADVTVVAEFTLDGYTYAVVEGR